MDQLIWRLRSLLEKQSTCPPVFWEHRIGRYVKILLEYLKSHGLYDGDAERIAVVTRLSDFHDVGKSRVPLEILTKPGKLTDKERVLVEKHPIWGWEIISTAAKEAGADDTIASLAGDICLFHHERWDGKGYPMGLKGNEISLEIQAVALADAYDALCSARFYKKTMTRKRALEMIYAGECGDFPLELCKALKEATEIFQIA